MKDKEAADAEVKGEPKKNPTNPLSVVSQQVVKEGNFDREQKYDNLKHCLGPGAETEHHQMINIVTKSITYSAARDGRALYK